jgi:hypothetical protein
MSLRLKDAPIPHMEECPVTHSQYTPRSGQEPQNLEREVGLSSIQMDVKSPRSLGVCRIPRRRRNIRVGAKNGLGIVF